MLTGVSVIALTGGDADAAPLKPGANGEPATIFAQSSDVQDMMALARQVAQRADDMMAHLDRWSRATRAPSPRALANVEVFSKNLADAAPPSRAS